MSNLKTNKAYFNKSQQYVMYIAARIAVVIASRRFGKSEGILAPTLLRNVQYMPRSLAAIVGTTFKQVLTRTLPATLHALNRLGYIEGIHYYIGRQAPRSAQFKIPHIKPKDWTYYIHWYNGTASPIISQDVPYSSNSLTLDSLIIDEAKTINYEKLQNETIPALSGLHYFKKCPWHLSQTIVTDMPTKKAGMWVFKYAEQMDKDLIRLIEHLVYELYEIKKIDTGSEWYRNKIKAKREELDYYRSQAVLYAEYNILDNLEIVGEKYINDMIRNLDPFVLMTALMSKRLKHTKGGYYEALSDKLHYYTAYNNNYYHKFRKSDGSIDWRSAAAHTQNCLQDEDIKLDQPLRIAFDTNININWLIVGQPDYQKMILYTLKAFYVKNNRQLPELCNDFADYYASLSNKEVIFYYDHTFKQGRNGISMESYYQVIERVLSKRGWRVRKVYIGQAMKHDAKHKEIDQSLKGLKGLFPKFNQPNCESMLTGMEQAMSKVGVNGWGKDKTGEKNPDTPEDPVEHRTDGGDAWDTLFIGCSNHPEQGAKITYSTAGRLRTKK